MTAWNSNYCLHNREGIAAMGTANCSAYPLRW